MLKAWAKTLNSNIDSVAKLISEETGKPFSDAGLEATVAINHLLWVAKNAEKILKNPALYGEVSYDMLTLKASPLNRPA